MPSIIVIELNTLFPEKAVLSGIDQYLLTAKGRAGEGNEVILTGAAPVWLYLKVAHALHGKARRLVYRSPASGDVEIFDHNPL